MSNLLFWMFLHTPLTIIQRRGHEVKEFPEPNSDEIKGVDATISEGWIDLKVRNDTDCTYQIWVTLDDEKIIGQVSADKEPKHYTKLQMAVSSMSVKVAGFMNMPRLNGCKLP